MTWHQTGATHYHAKFGLLNKGHTIKGLVDCNSWDLEPLDLLKVLLTIALNMNCMKKLCNRDTV